MTTPVKKEEWMQEGMVGYIYSVSVVKVGDVESYVRTGEALTNIAKPSFAPGSSIVHYPNFVLLQPTPDMTDEQAFNMAYNHAVRLANQRHPTPYWTDIDIKMTLYPSFVVRNGMPQAMYHFHSQEYSN